VWLLLAGCTFVHGSSQQQQPQPDAPKSSPDAAPDAALPACGNDFTLKFNGHSYKLSGSDTWDMDEAECAAGNGHLVKIENMAENDWLHMQIGGGFAWTGLRDTMNNDTFYWTDGTMLGSFTDFSGNPNSPMNNCVDMGATAGTWAVYDCTFTEPGLCECP